MKYKRNCPICNIELTYIKEYNLKLANNKNSVCASCARIGKPLLKNRGDNNPAKRPDVRLKMSLARRKVAKINPKSGMGGKFHTNEAKEKIKNGNLGKKLTEESIKKRTKTRRANGWNKYPNLTSIKRSNAIKKSKKYQNAIKNTDRNKKIRLKKIEWIQNTKNNGNQIFPAYNTKAIPILEQKAKELGITDLMHAENGGEFYIKELGYWVDGYSKEKNIVIEYYEKYHNRQTERDERRKQEIVDFLKCNFYEIKE